ncbi:hypothetical protein GCM10009745_58760 [Kribbella yunnanensis]|uniref:Uncharacterized protein n=1 Tax=Kribbella yunnanensis TaxID=190194 RepID=A0ABP4UJ20_9ACTN
MVCRAGLATGARCHAAGIEAPGPRRCGRLTEGVWLAEPVAGLLGEAATAFTLPGADGLGLRYKSCVEYVPACDK